MASGYEHGHKYEQVKQVIAALDEAYKWIMTGVSPVPYPYYEFKYKPSWEEEDARNATIKWIQGDMQKEIETFWGWKNKYGIVKVPDFNGMDFDMKLSLMQKIDTAMCINPNQFSAEYETWVKNVTEHAYEAGGILDD